MPTRQRSAKLMNRINRWTAKPTSTPYAKETSAQEEPSDWEDDAMLSEDTEAVDDAPSEDTEAVDDAPSEDTEAVDDAPSEDAEAVDDDAPSEDTEPDVDEPLDNLDAWEDAVLSEELAAVVDDAVPSDNLEPAQITAAPPVDTAVQTSDSMPPSWRSAALTGRWNQRILFCIVAELLLIMMLVNTKYTIGTTVSYDGAVVASVATEADAREVCARVENITSQALSENYSIDPERLQYQTGILSRDAVSDADTLAAGLSDQIGLVAEADALYVNGELVGAIEQAGGPERLLEQLQDEYSDANTISCSFREQVEVKREYVPTAKLMQRNQLSDLLHSIRQEESTYTVEEGDTWSEIAESHGLTSEEMLKLNPGYDMDWIAIGDKFILSATVPYLTMNVVERESYVSPIPYEVEYTDTPDLYVGDYDVISPGQEGAADVVANVTYVNGVETERTVLSSVTISNPVTEHRLRGTKERPTWQATGTFRWPCSGSITSRFGYRNLSYAKASHNHKGIDIANSYGTPVCAADGGTVIYAGWMNGYGYFVQIDHGNGYVTCYGHNSRLLVSVGQHVYKGQQIAKMGSTGNSTGNHCHFEVRVNGVPKNPLNYL